MCPHVYPGPAGKRGYPKACTLIRDSWWLAQRGDWGGGGAQGLPRDLGRLEDSQLPLNPSGSESCCLTVEDHIPDSTRAPSPEPRKPPQLGPIISASCRGGGGEQSMAGVPGALLEGTASQSPKSLDGPSGPLIRPWAR